MGFVEKEVYGPAARSQSKSVSWQNWPKKKKCVKCKLDKMSCQRSEHLHVAAKADILRIFPITWNGG